jgi:hypothetical protein
MRLKTNLRGQVRQTALPKWKCLLPLFEAVMNSFQAIQDADPRREHSIVIDCKRDNVLNLGDELAPFTSFAIKDTGVGFDDANFESFNTAFSEYKYERGGKGLGRIMWLVAFDKAEIDSVFLESDSPHPWRRTFTFDTNYNPDQAPPAAIESGLPGTTIVLSGFKNTYREECPRSVESLAQRIIEHPVPRLSYAPMVSATPSMRSSATIIRPMPPRRPSRFKAPALHCTVSRSLRPGLTSIA